MNKKRLGKVIVIEKRDKGKRKEKGTKMRDLTKKNTVNAHSVRICYTR